MVKWNADPLPAGIYTVVFEDGAHMTLRVRPATWATSMPQGTHEVAYLYGPENDHDYTGFAFVFPDGGSTIWKKFRDPDFFLPGEALQVLLSGGLDAVRDAGEAYALRSGRCWRCDHRLTVPASIHRGLGPVCAKVVAGEWDEGED